MARTIRLWVGLVVLAALALSAPLTLAQGEGPRTVTGFMGRSVTLEQAPARVVGMSASINEMLFAIGVTPVGATEGMDYPPAAADLPTFGSGYQPDLEALAALEPDLIIANAQLNMQFMDQLEAIAPTLPVMTLTAADVPANIRLLGQATWRDTAADYVASSYEDFLALAGQLGAGKESPTVLIIVGTLGQPNYGKSSTYLGDMLARLGATNIADGREDQGPFPGYTQLSAEAILEADPDFIFTVTRGVPTPLPELMAADPIWSSTSAFQNGHVYDLDSRLYVESPGPRFTEAMLNLYNLLYGEGAQ